MGIGLEWHAALRKLSSPYAHRDRHMCAPNRHVQILSMMCSIIFVRLEICVTVAQVLVAQAIKTEKMRNNRAAMFEGRTNPTAQSTATTYNRRCSEVKQTVQASCERRFSARKRETSGGFKLKSQLARVSMQEGEEHASRGREGRWRST